METRLVGSPCNENGKIEISVALSKSKDMKTPMVGVGRRKRTVAAALNRTETASARSNVCSSSSRMRLCSLLVENECSITRKSRCHGATECRDSGYMVPWILESSLP